MLRLTIPTIENDDLEAVREALASGYLVQGPRVAAFERAVAEYVGVKHAVAVTNCTAALQLALLALDIGKGDLVIVTSYSWVSTANVIELCGAQPVFTDIRPDTFNMDPEHLEEVASNLMSDRETAGRVKAILPVHTFGQVADMPRILEVGRRYELPVIEDAACALGARLHGKQAGTWGVMGCFSFHPRKAITTGEGGIITTNEDQLAWRLRTLRNHGQDPNAATPTFIVPGFNFRLTEIQAALGLTQMAKLDRIVRARRSAAAYYDRMLKGTQLAPPTVGNGHEPVYQSYVALLPNSIAHARSRVIERLGEQGVETNIGTWHLPLTPYYRTRYGFNPGDFPVTDEIFSRTLTLPLFEGISKRDQKSVVSLACEQVLPGALV
jgi:perosamine synthetase